MTKLNANETTAYATTILQKRNVDLYEAILQLASDTMDECGIPESDLDHDIQADFANGLIAKLVFRHHEGRWPEADFGTDVDATLTVTEAV